MGKNVWRCIEATNQTLSAFEFASIGLTLVRFTLKKAAGEPKIVFQHVLIRLI